MSKITPIGHGFQNLPAFLAHIAEDAEAVGFVGAVMRKDGAMIPVQLNVTREQMAFAAALWLQLCLED